MCTATCRRSASAPDGGATGSSFGVETADKPADAPTCFCGWPCCFCCSCGLGIVWFLSLVATALLVFFLVPRPVMVVVQTITPQSLTFSTDPVYGATLSVAFQLGLNITNANYIGINIAAASLSVFYIKNATVLTTTTAQSCNTAIPPVCVPLTTTTTAYQKLKTLLGTVSLANFAVDSCLVERPPLSYATVAPPSTADATAAIGYANMAADYVRGAPWMLRVVGPVTVVVAAQTVTVQLDTLVPVYPQPGGAGAYY
jgi:hypothetical protein